MVTREYVLTVAQSKRLIALGVVNYEVVQHAMAEGLLIVCPGTTNSYVLEELLGERLSPFAFTTGVTLPAGVQPPAVPEPERLGYVIFRQGELDKGMSLDEALEQLGTDDVVVKGGNALNYCDQVAGVLIGHPEGGTMGKVLGCVTARKAHLVMPIGLEKEIPESIPEVAGLINDIYDKKNALCSLWPVHGAEIITELEAIDILTDCYATQISAGGVLGAEGSVRVVVTGEEGNMEKLDGLMAKLADEKPFGEGA